MKKPEKKRLGRPPGRKAPHRPVLSVRVPEDFYESLKVAAQLSGRTLSEEVTARAKQTFEWEKTFGDVRKLMTDAQSALAGDLRRALRNAGYTMVMTGAGPSWLEPGNPVDAAIKRLMEEGSQ